MALTKYLAINAPHFLPQGSLPPSNQLLGILPFEGVPFTLAQQHAHAMG